MPAVKPPNAVILRPTSSAPGWPDATRDERVQAERDRRASDGAVSRWANDNTADLRQLIGQITALTDLDAVADFVGRLHDALGDTDLLPGPLATMQPHLPGPRCLPAEIDAVTAYSSRPLAACTTAPGRQVNPVGVFVAPVRG